MALRPEIVKLCKIVGGISGVINKIDENAPEYYALASILTDEQAIVAQAAGLRKERTAEYLAAKVHRPVEEVRKIALDLADIGVFRVTTDRQDHQDRFFMQIFAPGIMEMLVNNQEQLAAHPEVGKAFEEYTRIRMATMAPMLPNGYGLMRVVPIESAIKDDPKANPYEKISYYLDKYDTFSVSPCSCRASRRSIGEGCGHLEEDMCVQMGKGAEYYIRTKRARQVSRQEVEEILKRAEENGLMHDMPNVEEAGDSAAICNCCVCSCFGLRVGMMFGARDAIRSNYVAKIEEDKCVACGQCVENCPAGALKMGQKICTKTPIEPVAAYKKLRNSRWSEKDWNVDYRENREDVVDTGTAPCKSACPAHIAVQGYIKLAANGRYMDALELIKKENPFPAICGRICNHRCEDECTRGAVDEPIAIDEIKRFIADMELTAKGRFIPAKRYDCHDKKIAIIGSGPAGLSCAYYLAIDNYDVTVFEKEQVLGGMLRMGIPSFRLEKNIIEAEIEVLRELGVKFQTGVEVGVDVSLDELRKQGFLGFGLAIGAQGGRNIGVPGEEAAQVMTGIDFLRKVNLSENVQFNGRTIVIGGGNVAIDVARAATRVGSSEVSMYCLEDRNHMPAAIEEIEEALEEGIQICNSWGPKEIVEENGQIKAVLFRKCVSVFDPDGSFHPRYDEEQVIRVECENVLLSVGQSIQWGKLLENETVELNRNQTVKAKPRTLQTGQKDIFVAGDVYTGPKFAIDAIAAGKEMAISLHRFVQPGQSLVYGRDQRHYHALDKNNVDFARESYDHAPRQKAKQDHLKEKQFMDSRQTFTEEQMKLETSRCLGCGATKVDEYLCVGCGQCTVRCTFDAIRLEKVRDLHAGTFETMPIKVAEHVVKRSGAILAKTIKGE